MPQRSQIVEQGMPNVKRVVIVIDWPPRSPDLIPSNFYLLWYLKAKYRTANFASLTSSQLIKCRSSANIPYEFDQQLKSKPISIIIRDRQKYLEYTFLGIRSNTPWMSDVKNADNIWPLKSPTILGPLRSSGQTSARNWRHTNQDIRKSKKKNKFCYGPLDYLHTDIKDVTIDITEIVS